MTTNKILMQQARASLSGKWGIAVGTFAVFMVIVGVLSGFKGFGQLAQLLIRGPFAVGACIFSLNIARGREAKLEQIFEGFKNYGRHLGAFLLVVLFTFLWSLLLIIPGIIASIRYSQTFFILSDDGSIGAREAIRKSKAMMFGNKWKYFCLGLRFVGWCLLSILTLGIGFLWLVPYIQVSMAKFYDDVRNAGGATAAAA